MLHKFPFLILLILTVFLQACDLDQQINQEIEEAREARIKSDSLLKEFKKVNEQLQKDLNNSTAKDSVIHIRTLDSLKKLLQEESGESGEK